MKLLDIEQQRRRFDNITFAETSAKKYLRKHQVHRYIPGQAVYRLGEYPAAFSIAPTEYDELRIKELAEAGVGLIQIHEEWNDAIRALGADKYSSHDPAGMHKFIDLCHKYGIKILPYFSTGFFDVRDPDYIDAYGTEARLDSGYFRYTGCNTHSPEWVSYNLKKMTGILDHYGFDGIYNDMGYPFDKNFKDGYIVDDPYIEDTLGRIYSEVKDRGGIVKVHQGLCISPKGNTKVYDYLWVGECVSDIQELRRAATFEPYVVPCPDFRFMKDSADGFFAKTIPFMQFEIRLDGRPVTGDCACVPGVEYVNNPANREQEWYEAIKAWHDAHPDGPHVYSPWSAIPDDPAHRDLWKEYLALYRPMVEESSNVYIDIQDSTLIRESKPQDLIMSLFVNEECYLVISNVGTRSETVTLNDGWIDRRTGKAVKELTLAPDTVHFLIKA
jgi:hypothetical protein